MRRIGWSGLLGMACALGLGASSARAEIECGDGSDGAFNPSENVEIDLAKALPGHWKDTPGGDADGDGVSDGVYDKDKWAIVFKYSIIDVPEGVTVTFKNHPANPPVVWLSQGDVNIAGIVSVNGGNGAPPSKPPSYATPGPGGFEGARRTKVGLGIPGSAGFGPGGGGFGGSGRGGSGGGGGAGHYSNGADGVGYQGGQGGPGGAAYGANLVQPLMGGSGGGAAWGDRDSGGGGAGAGGILIASCGEMKLLSTGQVVANGGSGDYAGGGGSGGAIRLIATRIEGNGSLYAVGGTGGADPTAGAAAAPAAAFDWRRTTAKGSRAQRIRTGSRPIPLHSSHLRRRSCGSAR